MLGLALLFLVFAAAIWQARWSAFSGAGAIAIDYRTFVDFGHRLLADGTPYLPYQFAPYAAAPIPPRLDPSTVPMLYPPPFALVGVALTVLPWPVWWLAVPILAWSVRGAAPWTWPIIAFALAWPATPAVVIVGGSTMWAAALVALGLRWGWPAALVLLKPTLLPFALVGARHRGWWVVAAGLVVVALPLASEYVTALRNVTDASPLYSVNDLPLLLVPVVAWVSRVRRPAR